MGRVNTKACIQVLLLPVTLVISCVALPLSSGATLIHPDVPSYVEQLANEVQAAQSKAAAEENLAATLNKAAVTQAANDALQVAADTLKFANSFYAWQDASTQTLKDQEYAAMEVANSVLSNDTSVMEEANIAAEAVASDFTGLVDSFIGVLDDFNALAVDILEFA